MVIRNVFAHFLLIASGLISFHPAKGELYPKVCCFPENPDVADAPYVPGSCGRGCRIEGGELSQKKCEDLWDKYLFMDPEFFEYDQFYPNHGGITYDEDCDLDGRMAPLANRKIGVCCLHDPSQGTYEKCKYNCIGRGDSQLGCNTWWSNWQRENPDSDWGGIYYPQYDSCNLVKCACRADPHMQLWNGTWYDYHGECTLVFMHAPNYADGLGLDIHIRTEKRYEYSFIESAAIKIGDDILEVSSWGEYSVNGVESAALPAEIGGRVVTYKAVSEKEHHYIIPTGRIGGDQGEHIHVHTFKDMVSIDINNGMEGSFEDSVGLMGHFPTGAMLGRDGQVLHEPNDFGQEWQVLDTEPQLFQTLLGPQYPQKCALPDVTSESRRRLGDTIARGVAEEACSHHPTEQEQKNCVFDVMATGDIEYAHRRSI